MSASSDYWGKRLERIAHSRHDKSTDEVMKYLVKEYERLNKLAEKGIESIYFDMLENEGEISVTKMLTSKRYKTLIGKYKAELQKLGRSEIGALNEQMQFAYKGTFEDTAKEIGLKSFDMLSTREIETLAHSKWSGKDFPSRVWTNKNKMLRTLRLELKNTIGLGLSKDKAVGNIMSKLNVGFSDADRLVRTELMHVINSSQRNTYKQRGYTKVEWLTAEDERVCKATIRIAGRSFAGCRGANGAIFDVDADINDHARGRCTTIPVLESMVEDLEE